MNKILRYSFVALLAMIVGNVMADTSTLTFTKECGGSGTASDGAVWIVTSDGAESTFDNTKGIHYGTGSKAVQYIKLSTSGIEGAISKIVVNASTANGVSATVDVTVAGAAFGGAAQSLTTSAADYTFEGNASGAIVVTVTKPESATKALYVKSVVVTYTGSDTRTETSINFAEGYKTKIGRGPDEMFPELGSFVALPTATVKAGDAVVSSEVEWTLDLTSWDGKEGEEQPSINDGKINNLNNGSGLITVKASYAGNDTYKASTKSYDLKVYSPYGLLNKMVDDIFDSKFEKDDMNDKDGKPVFYFFRNIDAAGIPVVTNTVTFVSGNYIYLTDGNEANLLFFGNNTQNLKKGDVISGNVSDTNLGGFWGNLKRYNKLPEFAFTDMNVKVESEGATVTPKTIKIDELAANINNYVKVENAEFVSASGKNLTFKVGETPLTVYNQFNLGSAVINALEATAMYTIEAMGSVYKKDKNTDAVYQVYPISFTKTSEPTGINTIKTDADVNAPAYNLAGQKVDKSYKGVVIMNGKKMIQK